MAVVLLGAASAPNVVVNDRLLATHPAAQLVGNRVLLPMRAIFEALGAAVRYDDAHRAVIAHGNGREIYLPIGATFALVDSKRVTLDVASFERGGHTFVPLRFVAESLGATVAYIGQANLVTIRVKPPSQVAHASPISTPYPQELVYAPTPAVPPLPNPTPYPDYDAAGIYPYLPGYATTPNGLFFGVIGVPGGWGYFSISGVTGEFPLMPWPGIPGRFYGVANLPLIAAASLVNVYGRFYTPQGFSQTFSLSVPLGSGAAAPLIFPIPVPAPTPSPAATASPTVTPTPYRTALPPIRRPVASPLPTASPSAHATPTPAMRHLLKAPPRRPSPSPRPER